MTRPKLSILVVDDNRSSADALSRLLRKQGDEAEPVYDGQTAIDRIRERPPDVVLTDLKMEPVDGMAVLAAARSLRPPVETIVFTAYGGVDLAVRAMHLGARDFLTKPVTVEQVSTRLEQLRHEREARAPKQPAEPPKPTEGLSGEEEFIAQSESSQALLKLLERCASVPSPVFIEGEVGSGRTFCAKKVHALGSRDLPWHVWSPSSEAPWPEQGTILLPGVDDLPEDLQRNLYRRLQQLPPGVRLMATARPDGRRQIAEGTLRPELYYHLAVVVVQVPPLRRRPDDIIPLFRSNLRAFAARYDRPEPVLSARYQDMLLRHYWPGNIRELLNLAERTAVMGEESFHLDVIEDPGGGMPKIEPGFSLSAYLESVERKILVEVLRRTQGDRAMAGKLLGVERNTLRYKLNKYGLLEG